MHMVTVNSEITRWQSQAIQALQEAAEAFIGQVRQRGM